mmetsp:Transcript_102795/g.319709  ORF Transcript_102795/g.319709 Transcript_102795/m.319709 type:complete len:841 (+) Transcript_102795:72-2594(+)
MRALLPLLLPALLEPAAAARLQGLSQPSDPSEDSRRLESWKEQVRAVQQALRSIREDMDGPASNASWDSLKNHVEELSRRICDCNVAVLEGITKPDVERFAEQVERAVEAAQAVVRRTQNLPVGELIAKKSILRGIVLQVPPVRNSFCDQVVRLRPGADARKMLVDPRDHTKVHYTSHFISQDMSDLAIMGSSVYGVSFGRLFNTAFSGALNAITGALTGATNLVKGLGASLALEARRDSLQRTEVYVDVRSEPQGAVAIDFHDLELAPAAVGELQLVAGEPSGPARRALLRRFLKRFGSHVCHKVTLGGLHQIKAQLQLSLEASTASAAVALSNIVARERSAGVKVNAASFALADATGKDTSKEEDEAKAGLSGETSSLEALVTTSKETNGGEHNLPASMWSASLLNNELWEVTDRHVRDCTPVWDFADRDPRVPTSMGFGANLSKEMFQVWYTNYLSLQDYAFERKVAVPQDFESEVPLMNWIVEQQRDLGSSLKYLEKCDRHMWCHGRGDCGPETHGKCKCYKGYKLHRKSCVADALAPWKPVLGLAALAAVTYWLFARGGQDAGPKAPFQAAELFWTHTSLLELSGLGPGLWESSNLLTLLELFFERQQRSPLFAGSEAVRTARLEEAVADLLEQDAAEEQLVRGMALEVQGQEALGAILQSRRYRSQLALDAEHWLGRLRGDALQGLRGPDALELDHGKHVLLRVMASQRARDDFCHGLSSLLRVLGNATHVRLTVESIAERAQQEEELVHRLQGEDYRHRLAQGLSEHARKLARAAGARGAALVVGSMLLAPSTSDLERAIVRDVLPMQGALASGLIEGLRSLEAFNGAESDRP